MFNTVDYGGARLSWARALRKCGIENDSQLALELATEHLLDLAWLCHNISFEFRHTLAYILLDQGRLQECYDFIKWWQVSRVHFRGQLWILIGYVYSVIPLRRTASAHF